MNEAFLEPLSVVAYKKSREGSADLTALTSRVTALEPVIVNTSTNSILINKNYLVSADASSGSITITLPTASYGSGKTCTVTKTDSSSNIVTIDSASLIAGESFFDLLLQYESLTLFSNGTEWIVS